LSIYQKQFAQRKPARGVDFRFRLKSIYYTDSLLSIPIPGSARHVSKDSYDKVENEQVLWMTTFVLYLHLVEREHGN